MSPTYYTRRKLRLHDRAMKGVATREAKRLANVAAMRDVGGFVTDGCLGTHTVRLLTWPHERRHVAVVVDGQHRQARTLRGVARIVAEMIFWGMK